MSRRTPLSSPLTKRLPVAAAVLLATGCADTALRVTAPNPPNAVLVTCSRLSARLPDQLNGLNSRLVTPKSTLVHAWGKRPVILRCGVSKPAGYDPNSPTSAVVDGVTWFEQIEPPVVVWTAVRTGAVVELTIPNSYEAQGGFLVEVGAAIKAAVP